ncbi:MAG: porin [Micavibrio sp.]|nr:porin [Micavibrio sp.]
MKKLLLTTAACGLFFAASPASAADGVKLDLGGYVKAYGIYVNQDDDTGVAGEARDFDIVRSSEVHFSGETTLDSGLTVGGHIEIEADGNRNAADGLIEESYVYFSGGWGRVNFGAEDGAGFLLQVATPSADATIDGVRTLVNPVNETAAALTGLTTVDYDMDLGGSNGLPYDDKFTYLSPIMNGFQVGLTYTPDTLDASTESADNEDDVANAFGEAYEAALRYEGQFNNVGVNFGAGYIHNEVEATDNTFTAGEPTDDRTAWNLGLDLDIGAFGVGVSYSEDDFGETKATATTQRGDEETLVIGADYTTGPFKLGASYLNKEGAQNVAGSAGTDGVEIDRYTGGVVYTYGPGVTFRGSISHIEYENVSTLTTGTESDATSFLLGTQVKF